MARKVLNVDSILTDSRFVQLGFDIKSDGDLVREFVPRLDRDAALGFLREHPDVMALFLAQAGNGTVYWAGQGGGLEDGRSVGVRIVNRKDGIEAVGDNVFGEFLQGIRDVVRRDISDYLVEEVPVRPGQVICDFTRKGSYVSDIEIRENEGERFIHVDAYKPVRYRFDAGMDGTTGHAQRKTDSEVPFHTFVCPFGTSYPSPIIVGSAAEASLLYEQALRGELDWNALVVSLRERNLLDPKLTDKQLRNLISEKRSQFEWMRDEIINNPSLKDMQIVASSLLVPDLSMGRTVYDAVLAPSPAHVLARYINNPLLLFAGSENGVVRALFQVDKGNPERFADYRGKEKGVAILVTGSDTIGGREPGRKATTRTVRSESTDAQGRRIITNEKRSEIPMKGKEAVEADYAAFSARMDDILSAVSKDVPVRFVSGNASGMGAGVGIGTPRMLERYVKERGGEVYKYNFSRPADSFRSPVNQPADVAEESKRNVSVVLLEHYAECLPVLVGREQSVSFLLNPNDEDSVIDFNAEGLGVMEGMVCLSSSEDSNVRNVLSMGSLAADSGLAVVHVVDNLGLEEQRSALEKGSLISRSGLHSEVRYDGDLFKGKLRKQWSLDDVNHLSYVDSASGLHLPLVAEIYPSSVLVEGYPFRSVLGAYLAEVCSSLAIVDKDRMKAIAAAEGSVSELMKIYHDDILRGRSDTIDILSDAEHERCIRRAIRKMSESNSTFAQSLLDLDGRDVVFTSSTGDTSLFVTPEGVGENRFGLAFAAERDMMKELREARRLSEEQERQRLLDVAGKRQKLAMGSKAEGQKIVEGLPGSIDEARGAVWFLGTNSPLELTLKDGDSSFEMWDDLNGDDPLVREKVARPYIDDGAGGQIPNNYVYLFPSDLESFTGRKSVRNMPDGRNLTGVTRVDEKTGASYLAAVGIPVRFNNRGYELMNPDNMPCSYRMDNDASNFLSSLILSDCKARSVAISHGLSLCLPGRERIDGTSYYTLGQVFMDKLWSKKEQKMVDNPHRSPLNLSLVESYICLLESGKNYPLNCIPMPRERYFTQDDAVVKTRLTEGQRFISAEGRFISDLMMSLQIANATAIALGVPLRFPLDKDGHIDLGPGVPEQYRKMAEARIDSFIGVKKAEEQIVGKLPYIERIPLYEAGPVHDFLVKAGTDLYMKPNDLAVVFGPYDFSTLLSGNPAPLHEMAFRMDDGTIFTVKDSKSNRSVDPDDLNKYLNYSKNDERRFIIRTTNPDKTALFVNALGAYAERAKAIKVEARLVTEGEMNNGGLEGYVNLLSSNSDQFVESEHDIGREASVFNAVGTVNKAGAVSGRNIDGEDISGTYWGKVDAKDGFKGYAQIRYTMPDGTQSDWTTITDLDLAKDTVMAMVKRTYRSDQYVVPSVAVLEMLHKALAVQLAGASFRDMEWQSGRRVSVDDKVVKLQRETPLDKEAKVNDVPFQGIAVTNHIGNWSREEVEADSGKLYVFTDNTDRDSGHGVIDRSSEYYRMYGDGQNDLHFPTMTAAVIRGLDNAMPVSTQRWYHGAAKGENGRWQDADAEEFRRVIGKEFSDIKERILRGGFSEVVFPDGNGLFGGKISAITQERVPVLYGILKEEYDSFISFCQGKSLEGKEAEMPLSPSEDIVYTVSSGSYSQRTRENANADDVDFTIAIAVDFDTSGERCTAKAAGDSYISAHVKDFSDKSVKLAVKEIFEQLPDEFRSGEPMGVNFAGNGAYTLFAHNLTQEECDEFMVKVIYGLQSKGVVFSSGRSGGQTGIDEAAAAACRACGIPVTVHAPKDWVFRDEKGKDVKDEAAFKERFQKKDYKKLSFIIRQPKVIKKSVVLNHS